MTAVSLDEIKDHLNITTDVNDGELAAMHAAAEATISQRVGPLEQTTVTATVSANGFSFVLPVTPVISLTSAASTYWGVDTDITLLSVDNTSGLVRFSPTGQGLNGGSVASPYVSPTYTVTYEAGYDILPDDLALAVKEMVRHLWNSQRGGAKRPGSDPAAPAPGYLIPNLVAELLEPHMALGFA